MIVYGIWCRFTVGRLASGRGQFPNRPLFLAVWLATVTYAVVALALLVVYLRHSRSDAAPDNNVLWTLLLLSLGPIATSYYWTHFVRPATAPTA